MNSCTNAPREAVLRNQHRLFRKLLHTVWQKSVFYREFYADHGILEHQLDELMVSDLPFISKQTLMEHFDHAVIDKRLRKSEIERWLNDVRDPRKRYQGDFVVVHSSGSSGTVGIFVYSRTDWNIMNSTMADRLPQPENYPAGKTRVGFFRAVHGHFAGVSTAVHLPNAVYDTLIVSVLDPAECVIGQLQRFQPHRMTGYSSSIAPLAQWAIDGRLRIAPRRIFVSGDLLTSSIKQKIQEAWGAPISNLYGASESLFLGAQETDDKEMMLMDDLNIFEILDEENRPIAPNEEGRVVITNLYNHTLPIVRYELGDYVAKGESISASGFASIKSIRPGKENDALPIILDDGTHDRVNPRAFTSFYAGGLERVQFISAQPNRVQINYVAKHDVDDEVRKEFRRILAMKGASNMAIEVRRVPSIAADPKTGKVRLVVLEGAAANESQPVKDTPAQTVATVKGGAVFSRAEIERSIVSSFERQVHNRPERLAIKSGDRAMTYEALNRASNRVAHAVLALSGEKMEPIAMLLKPGIEAVTAILGTLKSGKFYVPLDPGFPQARLAAIAKDAEPRLVVTDNANLASASAFVEDRAQLINIDDLAAISDRNPGLAIAPDAYAYLLYTSGSTGQPKGVIQNHRNVLHQLASYTKGLTVGAEDRLTFLHSYGFSASRLDIFGALLSGGGLFHFSVADEGLANLARWLREEEITLLHWVPTGFRHLVGVLDDSEQFPRLRLVVLGSEALSVRDIALYKRHFSPDCVLVNRFGTTETGNICWHFIDKNTELTSGAVPVGRAIEDTEVLVLDATGRDAGVDRVGEIAVRSSYLSPGYWRQPELTQAAFAPDGSATGRRIYRTGDIGYRLPDGSLVHAGRKDLQTKIRGYRMEIIEVENALRTHPAVREAAVVIGEERSIGQRLLAYIVARDEPRPTNSALRSYLEARLPAHMTPADFVWLRSLPLTPSGKVDRLALPRVEQARAELDTAFVEPRTSVEKALVEIWSRVLGIDRIGVHDEFFNLGGDSLLAGQVLSRVVRVFGVEVELRDFFDAPTIARMAEIIVRSQAGMLSEDELTQLLTEAQDQGSRQ